MTTQSNIEWKGEGKFKLAKWDYRFLKLAKEISTWSKDPSTKVGAVIANEKQVVSVGYNGFPSTMPDLPEYLSNRDEKYSRIVHGEINALIYAQRDVWGHSLYTWPFMPCDRCVVTMIQAGIRKVVAPAPTADQATRWAGAFDKTKKYLNECNVTWIEVDREEFENYES